MDTLQQADFEDMPLTSVSVFLSEEVLAKTPQEVFFAVNALIAVQRFREARDLLKEMMEDDEREWPEHFMTQAGAQLARLEYWLGNFSAAEDVALRIVKKAPECCKELAYEVLVRVALDRYEFGLAEQYESKLSVLSPARSLIRCRIKLRKGDLRGAEAVLNAAAVRFDDLGPEFDLYRSLLDSLRGDRGAALSVVRRIGDTVILSPDLQVVLVEAFLEAGEDAEAVLTLSDLRSRCPDHPAIAALEGRLLFLRGYFAQAEPVLRSALQERPSDQKVRALLVRVNLKNGKFEEASRVSQVMLADASEYYESLLLRGDLLFAQQKFSEARKAYQDSVLWMSDDAVQARYVKAKIALIDEDFERALRLFETLKEVVGVDQASLMQDIQTCHHALGREDREQKVGQEFRLRLFFATRQGEVMELVLTSL